MDNTIKVAEFMINLTSDEIKSVLDYFYYNDDETFSYTFFVSDDSFLDCDKIKEKNGKIIVIKNYKKEKKILKNILIEENFAIFRYHFNGSIINPLALAKNARIPVRIFESHIIPSKIEKIFLNNLKKCATHYFGASEIISIKTFGKRLVKRGRIYNVNRAINIDEYKFDLEKRNVLRKNFKIDDNTLVVGCVGDLIKRKNHSFLLEIFKEIHNRYENSKLLIIGNGKEREHIKDLITKLNLNDCVEIIGQNKEIYSALDIFLMPSIKDGIPVSIIEAQANGLLCFLSESITSSIKMLETTKFINIHHSASLWSKIILNKYHTFKRSDKISNVLYKNYDIKKESKDLRNLLLGLRKKRIMQIVADEDVEVMAPLISDFPDAYEYIYVFEKGMKKITDKKLNILELPKFNRKFLRKTIKGWRPDIIHVHDYRASAILSGINHKKGLVLEINNYYRWLNSKKHKSWEFNRALKKADIILVNSSNVLELLPKAFSKKAEIIGYYFNMEDTLKNMSENLEKKYDICAIAPLITEKNPAKFIRLVNELKENNKDIKALWVGSGVLKDEFKAQIDQFGLNKNIKLITNPKNVYNYLAQSKVFVLTSEKEYHGLIIFSALTLGLPCAISKVNNFSWEGKACIECDSIEEYVKVINSYNKAYNIRSKDAKSQACMLENKDKYLNDLLEIYEKIYKI